MLEVKTAFECEFGPLKHLFKVIEVKVSEAKDSEEECIWHPGVYVFIKDGKIIRVGRSFSNSRKRALEHVNHDLPMKGKSGDYYMNKLKNDPSAYLLLFNLLDPEKGNPSLTKFNQLLHWVAALEIFLELKFEPEVPSGRLG